MQSLPCAVHPADNRRNSTRSTASSGTSDESSHQEPTYSSSSSDEAEAAPPPPRPARDARIPLLEQRLPATRQFSPGGSSKRLVKPLGLPTPSQTPTLAKKSSFRGPPSGRPSVPPPLHLRRSQPLLDRIVERGKRRNSNFPVIDGLYAEANGLPSARGPAIQVPQSPQSPLSPLSPLSPPDQSPSPAGLSPPNSPSHDTLMNLMLSREETVDFCNFQPDDPTVAAAPLPDEVMSSSVTVAIRIRPLSKQEAAEVQPLALAVDGQKVLASDPAAKSQTAPTRYRFDAVLCSVPSLAAPLATQSDVFDALGQPLLRNLIDGYNACLLCYGQTGSGKTYTMMGTPAEPGLVPRSAEAVFRGLSQAREAAGGRIASLVQVSFIEIYNEKVHDLLAPDHGGSPKAHGSSPMKARASVSRTPRAHSANAAVPRCLRVRQHPVKGAFVEGLTQHPVTSGEAILELVRRGNEARATAATRMNERSSRSHAIVTIEVAQQELVSQPGEEEVFSSKTSRIHLVDLAGSERVTKSGVEGAARLQELTAINLSLSTLSRVIETLSDAGRGGAAKLPPYRESTLTWLLADSFGGNSKTTMIANVSPAANSLSETTSTLRYAARARRIVNQAVINEDPSAALISALQAETLQLRAQLQEMSEHAISLSSAAQDQEVGDLRSKLTFSEQLIEELKENEAQERLNFEQQLQRMSAHHEEQALTQRAMREQLDGTESQLQCAQREARQKTAEIEALQAKATQLAKQAVEVEERLHAKDCQIGTLEEMVERLRGDARDHQAALEGRLAAAAEELRCARQQAADHGAAVVSLEAQLAQQRADAGQQLQAKEAEMAALQRTIHQLHAREAESERCAAALQASLSAAAGLAEAADRQCAEALARVQETLQELEVRMASERAALQELKGLRLGGDGGRPTPQLLEEAERRLVVGWQCMVDDLRQCRDRLAQQEREQQAQLQELRQSCQDQRRALEETAQRLQEQTVRATGREGALQGGLEEKTQQVQLAQQESKDAQRREWESQQQLRNRMAAEWKALSQLRLPCMSEAMAAGVVPSNGGAALTADHLEAAEAQLVAVWQRVQADLLHCQQRLAKKEAEAAQLLQLVQQEKAAEAQRLRPEAARLAAEHGQLAAEAADLRQRLEEAAEQGAVAEQQRDEWEGNAKEMARQLQDRMVAEGRLLMALQCACAGLPKKTTTAGSDVDRALEALDALAADRAALQRRLAAAEEELARRRRWSATGGGPEGSNQPPPSAAELVAGLGETMAELESRVAAVAGQGQAVLAALEAGPGAEDVLEACERIMGQAREVLRAVSEQRLPPPEPGAGQAGPPLELVLQQLQAADHAQWAAMHPTPRQRADSATTQRLATLRPDCLQSLAESAGEGAAHLLQALVEEYTRMLQDTVENRREWRALYDGLSLTMQAVSGRPRFLLFQFGPASAQALEAALRRQEELNARAAAWLMGLYTQRDVLKQNVLAQLRVNERFAQERASLVTERKALHGELADVRGKLQRAIAVVRRLHAEHDALLTTPRGGAPALPEGPPAAALPAAATRDP